MAKVAPKDIKAGSDALKVGKSIFSSVSPVGQVLGPALGAYNAYRTWQGADSPDYNDDRAALSNAASGAAAGAGLFGPVGLVAGLGLGGAFGKLADNWKTGKHDDQLRRDMVRDRLVEKDFLTKDGTYTLSDGSTFEMGKDGGFRYEDNMRAYEVDHNDPLQSVTFGHALPLAELITGGNEKLKSDFAGYFTRMAVQNSGGNLNAALDNLKDAASRLNINQEVVGSFVADQVAQGNISKDTAKAYAGGFGNLMADSESRNLNFADLLEGGDFTYQNTLANRSAVTPEKEVNKLYGASINKAETGNLGQLLIGAT